MIQVYSYVFLYMQKDKLLSFRTTEQNEKYLRELKDENERSLSYIISKMIDSYRVKNVRDTRKIK